MHCKTVLSYMYRKIPSTLKPKTLNSKVMIGEDGGLLELECFPGEYLNTVDSILKS